jgi:peptidyl-prolyl cis-trans isomerase A (cyclophilin A)
MRLHAIAAGLAGAVLITAVATGQSELDKSAKLRNPAAFNETAPATFRANFDTSKGTFVVEVTREWAPRGADRFYNLVKNGFYDDARFFRVLPGFVAQFGMNGNPAVQKVWASQRLQDDPPNKQSNKRGYLVFATAGPNTRTTQLFINLVDNPRLDQNFVPFGRVVTGMEVVDKFQSGEADQGRITDEGNAYLTKEFKFDYVKSATISK